LHNQTSSSLQIHEWLAVTLLIGILGSIILISSFHEKKSEPQKKSMLDGIDILVKGAVEYPGIYHFPTNIRIQDLFAIAKVSPLADLSKYNNENTITKSRALNIPSKAMITINVSGAVKNGGVLALPKGTRLQDLLSILELEENADIEPLQKKRKLTNGELVVIKALLAP